MDFVMMWLVGIVIQLIIYLPFMDAATDHESTAIKKYGKWSLFFKKEIDTLMFINVDLPEYPKGFVEMSYFFLFWALYPVTTPILISYKIYNLIKEK